MMRYFAIYAGHGGSDSGAVSGSLKEKDYNLAVANKLAELLRSDGHRVLQNRTTDISRNITTDANRANTAGVDCVVEVHMNSNSGTPATGTEVLYYSTGTSKTLAENIQKRIVAATGYANRGAKQRTNLGILKQTTMPAALVEMAFINNNSDMAKFNIDTIARAIRQGIYDTCGLAGGTNISTQEELTLSQYTELKGVIDAQAKKITALEDRLQPKYKAIKDVPQWGRDAVQDALDRGVLAGVSADDLGLSWAEARSITLDYRRENRV